MAVDMSVVHAGVRRTRNTGIAVGLLTLVMGGGMVVGAVYDNQARVLYAVFGVFFLLVGVLMLRHGASMWDPSRAPVSRLVAEHPGDIRWIYVEQFNSQVGGATVKSSHAVKLADAADKLHTIMVKSRDLEPLLAQLRAAAPDALFGHDAATVAAHKARVAAAAARRS